jgi:hypothetical protein
MKAKHLLLVHLMLMLSFTVLAQNAVSKEYSVKDIILVGMFVTLPMEKFAAGNYLVTITSDIGNKIIKIIKQ